MAINHTLNAPRQIIIFVALLAAVAMVVWQRGNTQESNDIVSQLQVKQPAPSATPAPTTAPVPNAAAIHSVPTPIVSGQPSSFKAYLETHGNTRISPSDAQPEERNLQVVHNQSKEAVMEKQAVASTVSPFGSVRIRASTGGSRSP